MCSLCCVRLIVSQAKRCLLHRNLDIRFPCLLHAAATVVAPSKKDDSGVKRQRKCWLMLQSGAQPRASNHSCTESTSVVHTIHIRRSGPLLPRSGKECTTSTVPFCIHHPLLLINPCCLHCTFFSCTCTGIPNSSSCFCSRAPASSTERHHQHLTTALPHTSAPHSQHFCCVD